MAAKAKTDRCVFTLFTAERIRKSGFRFDRSWRHADICSEDMQEAAKAAFYGCNTVAANDIADNPDKAAFWQGYL